MKALVSLFSAGSQHRTPKPTLPWRRWFRGPAHRTQRLRPTSSWSQPGSDGFSGQTLVSDEQPGRNLGRGQRGGFPTPSPTAPTPHHRSNDFQPPMTRCPGQKHARPDSDRSTPPYKSPKWALFGAPQKCQHFFFWWFEFEKTPSEFSQTVRIIWFMYNFREIQSTCC